MKSIIFLFLFILSAAFVSGQTSDLDTVGDGPYLLTQRMAFYKVPGVSITKFEKRRIFSDKAFGFADNADKTPLDTLARFQAASISKSLTAVAVLRLAEQYALDLDRDVNEYLKTWKLPQSRFTESEKVTIRRLLSHTAGINVGGFGGYRKTDRIPTLDEILNGKGNSEAIKVVEMPGKKYQYSGGGYMILQKLVEDLTGSGFAAYMQKEILAPMGMRHSSFELAPATNVSFAHTASGELYTGGFYLMPESAPAGLWTTGADLARFCMALQDGYDGKNNPFLSQSIVKAMLASNGNYGLGIGLGGKGEDAYFFHGGKNRGYNNVMLNLYRQGGNGIIVLTNGDGGDKLRDEIVKAFLNHRKLVAQE